MVAQGDNGQQLEGPDDGALQNLEMMIYQASSQVGALAFIRLKQQAAALLEAGMDPRRFQIGIDSRVAPTAVQIRVKPNIVKATTVAKVPPNLRIDRG